jgi:hypothetical protein
MRKHLYGFALFTFIVATAVVFCGAFYYWNEYDVRVAPRPLPESISPAETQPPKSGPPLYELKSFLIDLEKNTATFEVKFNWESTEKPPLALEFNFGVTTARKPYEAIELGTELVQLPFFEKKSVTKTFTSTIYARGKLDPKATYYGYLELNDRPKNNDGVTKLVLIEKNRMAGSVPALIKHPKK